MGLFDFGKKPQRSTGFFDGSITRNVSPMEKYIREEERWHAWECPHDDHYDCDCY